jgi:multidrug resistance protein MdtO
MATTAQNLSKPADASVWFWEFLKGELAPYPGRAAVVARMVIAATIVMLITMTFQIPYGAYGAIYTLTISRESPQGTEKAVKTIIIAYFFGASYQLILGVLFGLDPMLRLFWIVVTFLIVFYLLSVMTNYSAASRFGYIVIITIPLWDPHVPSELKIENTLWAVGVITLASVIALIIELVFAEVRPWDDLSRSIEERLDSVEELLNSYIVRGAVDEQTEKKITRLATVGTSRLRHLLQRSDYSQHYGEKMAAVVALVGALVDFAASFTQLRTSFSGEERNRIGRLAQQIAKIRDDLLSGRVPVQIKLYNESETSTTIPLLNEMERTVSLIPEVFTGSRSLSAFTPSSVGDRPSKHFVSDALINSNHLRFAFKGCLAASLCYVIYHALFWPGISTCLNTCFLTALTTIGFSHQKQILRIMGAVVGGVVIGIGAQVFILPHIDSIGGFTLLFIAVTIVAAWFVTSSPRLSYFGVQIAIAFYLINLQEFRIQTSLTVARDRVVGILLGIFMMWLVFDHIWRAPAVTEMKAAFIFNLRLLAQLAREPISKDLKVAIERSYQLREQIDTNLNKVRTLADAVLFEFGPSRPHDLALRKQIERWLTQLRMLFVLQTAWLKYGLQLPGFELPEELREAQLDINDWLARMLEGMADRLEGGPAEENLDFEDAVESLERKMKGSSQLPAAQLETLQSLSRRMKSLTTLLANEIQMNGFPLKDET